MNADRPITNPIEDHFNYNPLATLIAPYLLLKKGDASLITGIEAPWGAGKTSFLNLTRAAIKEIDSSALTLEYCPWVYATVEALILGFCAQLSAQFDSAQGGNYKKLATAFRGLSLVLKPIKFIPGAELPMSAIEKTADHLGDLMQLASDFKSLDLAGAKASVQKAINGADKPIVIFIDDVDRLAPEEIRLLFQFLKAVADFDRVSYVIAYDSQPVEKALSYAGTLDGREFLKKFIQVPIRIPRLSRVAMKRFIISSINNVLISNLANVSDEDAKTLKKCATEELSLRCLATPRDVIRCINILRLRWTDSVGEVRLSDLFKFILLDLFCPEAVEIVRLSPSIFLHGRRLEEFEGVGHFFGTSPLGNDQPSVQKQRDALYETLPNSRRDLGRDLTESLFPKIAPRDINVRSANSSYGIIKLLYGAGSPMSFSTKEAKRVLADEQRKEAIEEKVFTETLQEWIYFLSSVTPSESVTNPAELAILLSNAALRTTIPKDSFFNIHRILADYICELIDLDPDWKNKQNIIDTIFTQEANLYVSESVLLELSRRTGLWKDGEGYPPSKAVPISSQTTHISPPEVFKLQKRWLKSVENLSKNNSLHLQPGLESILWRWGQFCNNNYLKPRKYVENFAKSQDVLILLKRIPILDNPKARETFFKNSSLILKSLKRYKTEIEAREFLTSHIKALHKMAH